MDREQNKRVAYLLGELSEATNNKYRPGGGHRVTEFEEQRQDIIRAINFTVNNPGW